MAPERIKRFGNLQCLLAGVWLRDIELIDIYPAASGVVRIERMLHVDERRDTPHFLRFGNDVLADSSLAR